MFKLDKISETSHNLRDANQQLSLAGMWVSGVGP